MTKYTFFCAVIKPVSAKTIVANDRIWLTRLAILNLVTRCELTLPCRFIVLEVFEALVTYVGTVSIALEAIRIRTRIALTVAHTTQRESVLALIAFKWTSTFTINALVDLAC